MKHKKQGLRGVSIVTTTWNERENIPKLVERIRRSIKIPHEIIVVDDSSPDGTYEIARKYADKAVKKKREGQTIGLLTGIKLAKYPIVVTLDADLENPPELIPKLLEKFTEGNYDLLVASRTKLPRISEKIASATIGRIIGVKDIFSNFRVYKRDKFKNIKIRMGETFGAELLAYAWKNKMKIGEYIYNPPPRRPNPRIGGKIKANIRAIWALIKTLIYMIT